MTAEQAGTPKDASPAAWARVGGESRMLTDGPREQLLVAAPSPVMAALRWSLPGWTFVAQGCESCRPATTHRVRETEAGFRLESPALPAPAPQYGDPVNAAGGLAGALTAAFVGQRREMLQIHAAAIEVAGGLVLLVGDSFAGKSSLTLGLALAGHRVFGDDRLAVGQGRDGRPAGMALGVALKIRRPLPRSAAPNTNAMLTAWRIAEHNAVAYLEPPPSVMAPRGASAPLSALVLLDRRRRAPARLSTVSVAAAVQGLVGQSYAPGLRAEALLGRVRSLCAGLPRYRLTFSNSRRAADLLASDLEAV